MTTVDISNAPTVTFSSPKSDTITSPEWVEGFEERKREWGTSHRPLLEKADHSSKPELFLPCDDVVRELDDQNPEELIQRIESGVRAVCIEDCDLHGGFQRTSHRFGNWIAWAGGRPMYGNFGVMTPAVRVVETRSSDSERTGK